MLARTLVSNIFLVHIYIYIMRPWSIEVKVDLTYQCTRFRGRWAVCGQLIDVMS